MPNEFQDVTADVTLATEVTEGVPGASGRESHGRVVRPEEDRTVFVDPVEQAILVDRTRQARNRVVDVDEGAPDGGDTIISEAVFEAPEERPRASAQHGRSADSESESDNLFGNYRVVAPLPGATPMLLAEHATLGFPVAIKMLPPALIGSPDAEGRFFSQAMVASHIAHSGIPMVLDVGHDQRGIPYLAMEYLPGETLASHLARGGLFSLDQVLAIGAQVASVLVSAHACGLYHGDISPENVHLCPDSAEPSGLRVKLLEFGAVEPAMMPGWPRAPEVAMTGVAESPADIYALGCVLYQLLVGRPPFAGSAEEIARAQHACDPLPPRAHRPDIPGSLDALVHRMVSGHPQNRPSSAADVERDLRAFLVGRPIGGAGVAPWARAAGWIADTAERSWLWLRRGSLRPAAVEGWRKAVAGCRSAAVHHPRWSVAILTVVLFLVAIGLFGLFR